MPHSNSERTEALIQAASIVQASDQDCKQVVFLSDALSVLQAYQSHKLPNLTKALQQVSTTRRAVLQWIPAHCGILGNEQMTSWQRRVPEENSMLTTSASVKRRLSSEHLQSQNYRGMTTTCCPGSNRSFW